MWTQETYRMIDKKKQNYAEKIYNKNLIRKQAN